MFFAELVCVDLQNGKRPRAYGRVYILLHDLRIAGFKQHVHKSRSMTEPALILIQQGRYLTYVNNCHVLLHHLE